MHSGTLQFDGEGNFVHVHRLVIRETDAAIDLEVTWEDPIPWHIEAPLLRIGSLLKSGPVHAIQSGSRRAYPRPTVLELHVIEQSTQHVEVRGKWLEDGESYEFGGLLNGA